MNSFTKLKDMRIPSSRGDQRCRVLSAPFCRRTRHCVGILRLTRRALGQSLIGVVSRVDCIVPSITAHTDRDADRQTDGRTDTEETTKCIDGAPSRTALLHFRRLAPARCSWLRRQATAVVYCIHKMISVVGLSMCRVAPGPARRTD